MNEEIHPNNLKEGEDFYYTPEGYKVFTSNNHGPIEAQHPDLHG